MLEHCQILGGIARALMNNAPSGLQSIFPAQRLLLLVTTSARSARLLATGSARPAALAGFSPELENQWGGHAGISQAAAKSMAAPRWLSEILGRLPWDS